MIRCVVTGQVDGRSAIVSDSVCEPLRLAEMPKGWEFLRLWGADEPPRLPTDGTPTEQPTVFPPPGGFRFLFTTLPPDPEKPVDELFAEYEAVLPGMQNLMEPDHPGMHSTDTVDLNLVLSGEVWLELDDGAELHLRPGDCVIQNGTRHAWRNRTQEPCRLFSALIGGIRE
jgi:mannose-6-phosphate isomerase-like protein (cupin superfamily)